MGYYNSETMTFDIPEKWKSNNIRKDRLPAESPRHLLVKKMKDLLSSEEYFSLEIWK
ncbi:MAG: hypothetical protein GF317_14905 [Candidatus Lokiarchaeota archaeon]|nr:hypothetical protein [Candidatus Lokiarchaeota archaeon]